MADTIKSIRVTPGVYFSETEVKAPKLVTDSTALGLVGETLKGRAFEATNITSWGEFVSKFGGKSPEKFPGSGYLKYEAPYIAETYLTESSNLTFTRVLGMSGMNRGCAWCLVGSDSEDANGKKYVIGIIRSNGTYQYNSALASSTGSDGCECGSGYDDLRFYVGEKKTVEACDEPRTYNLDALAIKPYSPLSESNNSCSDYKYSGSEDAAITASTVNLGRFKIVGLYGASDDAASAATGSEDNYFEYVVSLNPADKEYILNVLPSKPTDGSFLYIEKLYDVAWNAAVTEEGFNKIEMVPYGAAFVSDYSGLESVSGILEKMSAELVRKDVGKRFLYIEGVSPEDIKVVKYDYEKRMPASMSGGTPVTEDAQDGYIYTVVQFTGQDGKRRYYYRYYDASNVGSESRSEYLKIADRLFTAEEHAGSKNKHGEVVLNKEDGLFYMKKADKGTIAIECDMNNYKSSYRYSSTPWFVSNVKGDSTHLTVNKMFRFHTISDGNNSVDEVKVSIENISYDNGTFDVVVRSWGDNDGNPSVLQRFSNCNMTPGTSNYIGYKIGTVDGTYESKSDYIVVEVIESEATKNSVPAGFLGYPCIAFSGETLAEDGDHSNVVMPPLKYNTSYDEDINMRKQYFGLSNLTGIDADVFAYHGYMSTFEGDPTFMTHGFHLDSRLSVENYAADNEPNIFVDGETGYVFDTPSASERTSLLPEMPIIDSEENMSECIFANKKLRKFTACFAGGFDGWDEYRTQRTNTNEYRSATYKGTVSKSGAGRVFDALSYMNNPAAFDINEAAITSDYYAYLAGIRTFANVATTDINILVCGGIGAVNQSSLVKALIEVGEEERGDSIVPFQLEDHPAGTGDYVDDMFTADEAVSNLEDSEIESTYATTFFPSVKLHDETNNAYVYLSAVKDYVRDCAASDKVHNCQNFSIAGMLRGPVEGIRTKKALKGSEEETLYDGYINPVKTFSKEGLRIWGGKTVCPSLERENPDSPLTRIEARRTILRLQRKLRNALITLVFDPNDIATRKSAESAIKSICNTFVAERALYDYKPYFDESVEARERREMNVKLGLKVAKSLEWINIGLYYTPEGVSFSILEG